MGHVDPPRLHYTIIIISSFFLFSYIFFLPLKKSKIKFFSLCPLPLVFYLSSKKTIKYRIINLNTITHREIIGSRRITMDCAMTCMRNLIYTIAMVEPLSSAVRGTPSLPQRHIGSSSSSSIPFFFFLLFLFLLSSVSRFPSVCFFFCRSKP